MSHAWSAAQVLTGGMDKTAIVFNRGEGQLVDTLKGHSKKVTGVSFHPTEEVCFTASADRTARIWAAEGEGYLTRHVLNCHNKDVSGLSLHPTGDLLATLSLDGTTAVHSVQTGQLLVQTSHPNSKAGFTCGMFHPDGLLLGAGTEDNQIHVWDFKSQGWPASFSGHTGRVHKISFSENGCVLWRLPAHFQPVGPGAERVRGTR